VTHALARAREHGFGSVAFPVIGAGSGGFDEARALELMLAVLETGAGELDVTVVRYRGK
jgi:O-acetyl-ADP-ribose deacetylase (regulator of RNase III)